MTNQLLNYTTSVWCVTEEEISNESLVNKQMKFLTKSQSSYPEVYKRTNQSLKSRAGKGRESSYCCRWFFTCESRESNEGSS
ncbi:hypothetical protein EUTSA_v10006513mg [Eutrema salsugineum]|uniref:Uncharacterized protein n=1 Tax=Eutrema salsugineum TaxID=72664 RepID=V4LPM8_EUTSA|nr:hypothetical protein EUTSA_v10006513mg [Eutrema salsugineum]